MKYSGESIKRLREDRDLSQQEFADAIGITRELLNKVENNKRSVSKATEILIDQFLRNEIDGDWNATQAGRMGLLVDYLRTNPVKLSNELGQDDKYIDDVISGKADITDSFLKALKNVYPHVNAQWLLTGRGEEFHVKDVPQNSAAERSVEYITSKSQPDLKDKYIHSLENQIELLNGEVNRLEKEIKISLEKILAGQRVIQAQIKGASRIDAERHVGTDGKKALTELRTLDKYVGEFLTELIEKGT
jgi:transcriptional regulator with XRE-family HTH domain